MSQQRFDRLIESMERDGNTGINNIVIFDDNIIWDGQHRCCWLLSKYGEEYIINVLHCNRFHPDKIFPINIFLFIRHRYQVLSESKKVDTTR